MSVTYSISGRGAKGGNAKAVLIFTASFKVDDVIPNSTKTDLEVFIEGPEETQPKVNIMGGDRGTFHVGFTPAQPGQYWVDFIFKGALASEPFMLPIKDMFNKIPTIEYTGKHVSRGAPSNTPKRTNDSDQRRDDERRKEEADRKARQEADKKAQEEEQLRIKEENERLEREEAERKAHEEEEEVMRQQKMEEERKSRAAEEDRKAAIERKKAELAEKRKKENEEKKKAEEAQARAAEEEARARAAEEEANARAEKAEAEARAREEAKRAAKLAEEEAKRAAKLAEEEARFRAAKAEEEAKAREKAEEEKRKQQTKTASAPKPVSVAKPAAPPTFSSGDYAGHVVAMTFVLRARNKQGEPKTAGGDAEEIKVEANDEKITLIEDAGDGTYSFDYRCISGENNVSVSVRGKPVQGFPLVFRRPTLEEIAEGIAQKELEREMLEEARQQEEAKRKREEENRRQEELELERQMEIELQKQQEEDKKKDEARKKIDSKKPVTGQQPEEALSDAELKLREIEDRKKKIAEKRAEIARKREQAEALAASAAGDMESTPQRPVENVRAKVWEQRLQGGDQSDDKTPKKQIDIGSDKPASKLSSIWEQRLQGSTDEDKNKQPPAKATSTPNKGAVAARWLQSAQEEEKKDDVKTKVDIPLGTGATKVASLWKDRLTGTATDEKKVEKTAVDLGGGKGASKVASLWQNRLEGKEPEPAEVKKTAIDLPQGSGASKVASLWQSKLEEKPAEPKIEKNAPRRAGPSALAAQWEQTATTSASSAQAAKKDIEELKAMMAKEREQVLGGSGGGGGGGGAQTSTFTQDAEEIDILLTFLNQHLKGENIPQKLPLSSAKPSTFSDLSDGIALCKFFNKMIPDMLDVRVITMKVNDRRDKIDNWNLCVQSGKAAGCRLSDIKIEALADGDPESIQKVIFQFAKVGLETDIKMCEDYLCEWIPGVDVDTIAVMNIDDLLLKWANAVVKKAGHSRTAKNLTKDFQDSFFFTVLFNETIGSDLDLDLNELERAELVVMSSAELNRGPVVTLPGIVDGVYWQIYILLCSILLTAAELVK